LSTIPESSVKSIAGDLPAFGIADAHVHVWDITKLRYPWLDDVPFLNKTFTLADYKKACGKVQVDKMVFVQCECEPEEHLKELAWVTELAKTEPRLVGLVPWVPLEKGSAVEAELAEMAKNPLVKGVRRIIQFEPDLEFCLNPDFIAGVKLLPKYGFSFEVTIDYRHNKNALQFLRQCPEVKCIIDHIGKPDIKNHRLDPWRSETREFAEMPNVFCKVSSLATEADHQNWTVDDLRPFVECVYESFGFDRLVFAGDWPVSSQAASYETCVGVAAQLARGVSGGDLRKLFRENAERFYRI
jgi:L-fuconolactonase